MLKDINPAASPSSISRFFPHGDGLYFGAVQNRIGRELWRTDGTPEGTRLVKDICPGLTGGDPHYYESAGRWLYFRA